MGRKWGWLAVVAVVVGALAMNGAAMAFQSPVSPVDEHATWAAGSVYLTVEARMTQEPSDDVNDWYERAREVGATMTAEAAPVETRRKGEDKVSETVNECGGWPW